MKLIAWNCNMVFRKKAAIIWAHKPDIAVISECEHPSKLSFSDNIPTPSHMLWFGQNQNKGLGIFAWSGFTLKLLKNHNEALRMIIPLRVSRGDFNCTLFAVWANNPADPDGQYVTQVWKGLQHYKRSLKSQRTLLAGDFNSNTIWDKPRRVGNHSEVVQRLATKGIHSTYHQHFNQRQGKERHPTLYMYRHKDKPYHIDYCFASSDMLQHLRSVTIGGHKQWAKHSDHMPVIVEFDEAVYG